MNNHIKSEKLLYRTAGLIMRFRWAVILLLVVLTAFFIRSAKGMVFDNSADIWFVEGDESIAVMKDMEKNFGNDDFVSVFISQNSDGKFTPEMLKKIDGLSADLENTVPYVKKMIWLGNAEWIESGGDELKISGFMDDLPETQEKTDEMLSLALTENSYTDYLISRDKSMMAVYLDLTAYPSKDEDVNPRKTVAEAVNSVVQKSEYQDLKIFVFGGPNSNYDYNNLVGSDGKKLFLYSVIVMLALLFWLGRGIRAVLIPVTVVVISVCWVMGFIPLAGFTANLLTISVPTLLICVGIADSMHYISSFYDCADDGMSRHDSIRQGLAKSGMAMLFTSLTTAAGFLSFVVTHVKPYREMGVYIAAGVIFALVITLLIVPSFYSFGRSGVKRARKTTDDDFFDRQLGRIHLLVTSRPKSVIAVFILLTAVFLFGAFRVQMESNTLKLVKQGTPYRDNMDFVGEKMGGIMSVEFMIDTGAQDGIKKADFMKKLDELQNYLEERKEAVKVISIADVMKKMRKAMHNNDSEYYLMPDKDDTVAQYMLMYEASGGSDINKLVAFQSDKIRLIVRTSAISTAECRALRDAALEKADELFGGSIKITMSGSIYRYLRLNDLLGEAQKTSFLAALVSVFLLMLVVMRSFKLGIISMVPNIFPVVMALGIAGFTGMFVDAVLLCFAPIIIGVSVDDSIHFFTRFRNEFVHTGNYVRALKRTYMTVGRPIVFTTIVLVIGFLPLSSSVLTGYMKMAFMFGWAFSWALVADLFLAPALIMTARPLGKEKGE
ncbi:MAG: RND family transporter [Deferribacterales bacterium]